MNKNNHVPGIDSNTRTMGVLRGFENEIHIPRLQEQFIKNYFKSLFFDENI